MSPEGQFRMSLDTRWRLRTSAYLEACDHEVVADFPAGTERWFVDAKGYEAVIVNGVVVMEAGKHTGALPGEVIRGA